ncbi:unnamed protein product, partial [Mesorhabditis belari]|uniref:EamA domain-containing protein n=1 Tax=Mesorhabditis belari TaxID=2138241 RepID=A0AAF3EGM2_9BILA
MASKPLLNSEERRMSQSKDPYGSTNGSKNGSKKGSDAKSAEVEIQKLREQLKEHEAAIKTETQVKKIGELTASVIVILLVAFTWALSTQFSKTALTVDRENFYAPYFMMWFSTCHMIFCYPLFLCYTKIARKQTIGEAHQEALTVFKGRGLTPISLLLYVFPFLCLWVAANYSYARSLGSISASVATSISSCNTAIVYILSIIVLKEGFFPHKLLSVIFAIGGVVVMSFDGEISGEIMGIVLSIISATSAAFYKVFFKRVIGSASFPQVSIFMTCLGTLNLFLNVGIAFGLIATPWEWINFQHVPWLPLFGSALLSLCFNFTINFGIAVLNPLVISVGMLCGIPLNTVIDVLFRDVTPTAFFLTGTGLILISFLLIITPVDIVARLKRRACGVRDVENDDQEPPKDIIEETVQESRH